MENFIVQFLGTANAIDVLVPLSWALLAVVASLALGVKRRNKGSISTPKDFSWSFFFKDNILRGLGTLLLLFIGVVFYQDIYGEPISSFKALALGLCSDQLVAYLKNINKTARA